jgi:PAS domain S-box-containing protein
MKKTIKVLVVEDSPDDAELLLAELRRAGFAPAVRRVETEPDFLAELQSGPDIILSDYSMPHFSGLRALELLHQSGLNTPFILVSGTVGEDAAVEAMKRGAMDYLLKDRLARLGPTVKHALRLTREHQERQRAESDLRESEQKFRQIAENIREVFWITEPDKNKMIYISPAYETIWGRSCESLYQSAQNWVEAIHPDDRSRIQKTATTRQSEGAYDETYRIVRPDGAVRWIHDRAFPVRDDHGHVYRIVGVAEDITEQRKLEEQFLQAQKMEAIGRLAGGVAHDFNNLLAVIQMNCELLKAEGDLPAPQLEYAEGINAATQRAGTLTRQLLLFSRKEAMQPRTLDLNHTIGGMSKMLQRILGEDIRMEFKFCPQPLLIHADPGMMDQVLMNLAVNSRDAMPKGGKLAIETAAVKYDELSASQAANARPGNFACLNVSDTGCGIPTANLPHIFEPFYTTKGVGKGTGLGLATVFGIVHQHQGWIHVYSDVGQGTTFRIFLPRLSETASDTVAAMPQNPPAGGTETILLVEDDPPLRAALLMALQKLSYRVIEASDGIQALKLWKQHRHEIQLLLTDLVMPGGISGKELGELLRRDNPALKVVYASGYSAELVDKSLPLQEGVNFLTKPFQTEKLARILRHQLDAG